MNEAMDYLYPVAPKTDFAALEQAVQAFWEREGIFDQSIARRPIHNSYVFYDGPPFATGLPHYGHILTGVIKDLIPRFQAMCGRRVERRFGWDCHGVPAEFATEEELGLNGKADIERLGMAAFNESCRRVVLRYTQEWERIMTRIGRWVDFQNDYKTMDASFMESVWWVFRRLWDEKLIYRDYKVVHYSWRLSTSYSNFEATLDDAYRDREDPAVVAKFELEDEDCHVLAWTTTPWTLPSNMALAVGPEITYCQVARKENGRATRYILSKELVNEWFPRGTYEMLAEFPGSALVGRRYRPLMPYFGHLREEGAFRIIGADLVDTGEGPGVVHLAPAFGEDDFFAARTNGIPLVNPVDDMGRFTGEISHFEGMNIFEANPAIIARLDAENKLLTHYTITHPYPHDWRTDTPLIYRAVPSWYVNVTSLKERMLANNRQINWVPAYIGDGAFHNWLDNARDWAISRSRYWGTPIPVWICERCEQIVVVGSIAELKALSTEPFSGAAEITDLHRHKIDQITIPCSRCEGRMHRIPEVLDCWFESGSMPYGQAHYPFGNKAWFEDNFPADFIVEYSGQTRGWFYTLMVLSTALFDRPPFKNVVVHGVTLGEDGRKMSKRLRNYPDPEEMVDAFGADTLRLYLMSHPVIDAQDGRIERQGIVETFRRFTLPLWSAFSFLVRYAHIDGWQPDGMRHPQTDLDRWICSRLYALCYQVGDALRAYELREATSMLTGFVDDLTKWYIRRARERFWKPEQDDDKHAAYETLHEVLVTFAKIAAPFVPFVAEVMFKNLTGMTSVHLEDWPEPDRAQIDHALDARMETIRHIASLGLAARAKAQIRVRQPLAQASIHVSQALSQTDLALIADELNVKAVELIDDVARYADPVARPDLSVIGPRLGKDSTLIAAACRAAEVETLPGGQIRVAGNDDWIFDQDVIRIHYRARPGYACETRGDLVVVLDVQITEALLQEGTMRSIVRQIQTLRKEAGLRLDERVTIAVWTEDVKILRCVDAFAEEIRARTLANVLLTDPGGDWTAVRTASVDGIAVQVAIRAVEAHPGRGVSMAQA